MNRHHPYTLIDNHSIGTHIGKRIDPYHLYDSKPSMMPQQCPSIFDISNAMETIVHSKMTHSERTHMKLLKSVRKIGSVIIVLLLFLMLLIIYFLSQKR